MRKAAHPSGCVGSSNPRRWRGEWLHHHGGGVCLLFVLFVPSRQVVVARRMDEYERYVDKYERITLR
jgi:hypothetical protein